MTKAAGMEKRRSTEQRNAVMIGVTATQDAPRIEARQRLVGVVRETNISAGRKYRSGDRMLRIGQHAAAVLGL
jgi:hypothetical protein